MEIECYTEKHYWYMFIVGIPMVLLWLIMVPISLFIFIQSYASKLIGRIENRIRFGFLFIGFKKVYFYLEFIIIYRKILLVFVQVFLTVLSVQAQSLIAFMIIMMALYLQHYFKPFEHKILNEMEKRSILVSAVTMYFGLFFLNVDLHEVSIVLLIIMIFAINLYFIIYWLYYFLKINLITLLSKIPYFKRLVKDTVFNDLKDL